LKDQENRIKSKNLLLVLNTSDVPRDTRKKNIIISVGADFKRNNIILENQVSVLEKWLTSEELISYKKLNHENGINIR
jgi:hypothetical protein